MGFIVVVVGGFVGFVLDHQLGERDFEESWNFFHIKERGGMEDKMKRNRISTKTQCP